MAFESLADKFQAVFKKMRGEDKLTEANMDSAIREIRIALLEADVNYKVVKAFTDDVKEKALGQDVLLKVNPSEMLIKICHVPVIDNGTFIGVFSEEVLTSYLMEKGTLNLAADLKMKDFLAFLPIEKHPNERYFFMARGALLEDAREAFSKSKEKTGKRLAMIFFSEHGNSHG